MNQDPLYDILLATAFEVKGIGRLSATHVHNDYNRVLSDAAPSDVRTMKRKFRKAWRKIAKQHAATNGKSASSRFSRNFASQGLGLGQPNPTRKQKNTRKSAVLSSLRIEAMNAREKLDTESST